MSPAMQQGVTVGEYELIIVDNGSDQPVIVDNLNANGVEDAKPSPAEAANIGIKNARGSVIGVMIDGARLASPGLVQGAINAMKIHDRALVATLGFHLGSDVQMNSVRSGYNQEVEDHLLEKSGWTKDGYRLFDISVFAGSSKKGWFLPFAESNAIFMNSDMWQELNGFDENFTSPGGGLVNLDTYRRACGLPGAKLIILLGEGTFHQVHGGVSTNTPVPAYKEFHNEYVRIRGQKFSPPENEPCFFGHLSKYALPSLEISARKAILKQKTKQSGLSHNSDEK